MVVTGAPVVTDTVMGLVAVPIGTAAVAQGTGNGCTYGRVLYTCAVATGFFFLRQNGIAPEQHSNKMQQGRSVSKNVVHHGQLLPSEVVTVVMLGLGFGLGLEEVTSVHKRHKGRTDAANRMVFLIHRPCIAQSSMSSWMDLDMHNAMLCCSATRTRTMTSLVPLTPLGVYIVAVLLHSASLNLHCGILAPSCTTGARFHYVTRTRALPVRQAFGTLETPGFDTLQPQASVSVFARDS